MTSYFKKAKGGVQTTKNVVGSKGMKSSSRTPMDPTNPRDAAIVKDFFSQKSADPVEEIMKLDDELLGSFGANGRNAIVDGSDSKLAAKYLQKIKANIDWKNMDQKTLDALEDQNYHTLVQGIHQLKVFKGDIKASIANTWGDDVLPKAKGQ
jgi:hypothetical protein